MARQEVSLAPITVFIVTCYRLQAAWFSESKMINCRCWSATTAWATVAYGQLILNPFYCRYNVACIARVSSFSRLNIQTCAPWNAVEIAKACRRKNQFFCTGKLGDLVLTMLLLLLQLLLLLVLPFYGPIIRDYQGSWFQKKHSPAHTYHDHQLSFICFLHLLW